PVDEDPFDQLITPHRFNYLADVGGRAVDDKRCAAVAGLVPDGERPLLVSVDQKARRVVAVGERCKIHRKGALPYSSLLGGNSDDMHAPTPAALLLTLDRSRAGRPWRS